MIWDCDHLWAGFSWLVWLLREKLGFLARGTDKRLWEHLHNHFFGLVDILMPQCTNVEFQSRVKHWNPCACILAGNGTGHMQDIRRPSPLHRTYRGRIRGLDESSLLYIFSFPDCLGYVRILLKLNVEKFFKDVIFLKLFILPRGFSGVIPNQVRGLFSECETLTSLPLLTFFSTQEKNWLGPLLVL